jgi:hypothetical protein
MIELPDPKTMANAELWHVILDVFPNGLSSSVMAWYKEVEKEFSARKITLSPVMK